MAMEVAITLRTGATYDATVGALVAEEAVTRLRDAVNYAVEVGSKTVTNLSPGMDVAVVLSTLAPYDNTVAQLIAPGLANWLGLRIAHPVSVVVKTVTDTDPPAESGGGGGGNVVAYVWRMSNADDRAAWDGIGVTRKTYGVGTESGGRACLTCTFVQDGTPPTSWPATPGAVGGAAGAWCNFEPVSATPGDVVQFSFVGGWICTANSLVAEVDDYTPSGNYGYSPAQDRNGDMLRVSGALEFYDDDYNTIAYYDIAVMEPQFDWFAGGWVFNGTYYHPMPTMQVVVPAGATGFLMYCTFGPVWSNLAGIAKLVSVSLTVITPEL